VPWPYQFKWDGPWLFVLFQVAGGFVFKPLWLLAGFIAFLRRSFKDPGIFVLSEGPAEFFAGNG
jgi:hypothetical protein